VDTVPGLKQLQVRKRELLLESDLNRQVLRVELGNLSFRVRRFQRGYDWASTAWKWAAPLAGFLFARKFGKTAGVFAKGSLLLTALRAGWKAWEAMRQARSEPDRGR